MLSKEETTLLIRRAKDGDENAKEELVKENSPLIKSLVKRFLNKGIEYDDLFQLGSLGFIKAIYNYDEKFDKRMESFLVPETVFFFELFLHCTDEHLKCSAVLVLDRNISQVYKIIEQFGAYFQHIAFLVVSGIK